MTKKQVLKISRPRGVWESLFQKASKDHEELSRKEAQFQGSRGSRLLTRIVSERPATWPKKGSVGSGVVIADTPFRVNAPAASSRRFLV
uniref:Uncharacterized protein n=1 Tax=Hyaloperonospora arabidopsidis (strain Emoy2) TaxID=559515 RepID=M4BB27_HYAAE